MTEKEKAKAYGEALKRAREWSETKNGYYTPKELCEEIFPELKESEGERIKNLIYCLIRDRSDNGKLLEHNGVTVEEALAWLEKQTEHKDNNKLIWKHWSGCGVAGNGDGTQIYLTKNYNTYNICSCLSFECDYILLSDLDKLISGGDVDIRYKYLEDILKADDIYQMSMNDTMVDEAKSKVTEALSKMEIGKLLGIKNQDEQKPAWNEEDEHRINRISDFIWKNRKGDTDEIYQQEQDVNWLKSLKERYT